MDNHPEQKENLIESKQEQPPPYNPVTVQYEGNNYRPMGPVITNQPSYITSSNQIVYPGDNYFTLSIVLSFVWCIFGTCGLCCVIPAIIYAVHAREAEMRGDLSTMRSKRQTALWLNICGSIFGFLTTGAYVGWMVYHNIHVQEEYNTNPY